MKTSSLKQAILLPTFLALQISSATCAPARTRTNYAEINNIKQFLSARNLTASTPKEMAVKLFRGAEQGEGRQSEEILVEYPTPQTAVIVYTLVGLSDDSVAGIRYRIELMIKQNKWEVVWVGQQTKCQQGRGHQNWAGKPCV